MLAFQHQDEITARLFFFPKLFRIYQLSRPKIIFKQESSDFNFSTDPCTAQLILFPNAHGRTSLLSYPWRQMGLQTQNAIRIMVTSRRQKMAPINTSSAHAALRSPGSTQRAPRAGAQGLQQPQQEATQPPPYRTQHLLWPAAEACSACFCKVLLETHQAHSFALHC